MAFFHACQRQVAVQVLSVVAAASKSLDRWPKAFQHHCYCVH
jgi:hypothetical protein